MLKITFSTLLSFILVVTYSQHTFSILAIDTLTGEIGSAGATCGDSILWSGTKGAIMVSDIVPRVGVIHTQAKHNYTNQKKGRFLLNKYQSAELIKSMLIIYDDNPLEISTRQYGIIRIKHSSKKLDLAFYTGVHCYDHKGYIVGKNYIIIGNTLCSDSILRKMELGFLNSNGSLADKLMNALLGAKQPGADIRCLSSNQSSKSAFLRVAKTTDIREIFSLDINCAAVTDSQDPINEIYTKNNLQHNTIRK